MIHLFVQKPLSLIYPLLLSMLIAMGIDFAFARPAWADTEPPKPINIEEIRVDNYPWITITVTSVTSPEIKLAFDNRDYQICETDINGQERQCLSGISPTTVDVIDQPYHLLILLDRSSLIPNQYPWGAITRSIANLITAMGPADQVSILPFSNQIGEQSDWTSNQAQALTALNQIVQDRTMTKLNATLDTALMQFMDTVQFPEGYKRIVVIADQLDNTVGNWELMMQQLQSLLNNAAENHIPVDLICYGPIFWTPEMETLRQLLEKGGGRLETPVTTFGIDELLHLIYPYFKRAINRYTFVYKSKLVANNKDHHIQFELHSPYTLDSKTVNIKPLEQASVNLILSDDRTTTISAHNETITMPWTSSNRIKIQADTNSLATSQRQQSKDFDVSFSVTQDGIPALFGPYNGSDAFILLDLTVPKDRTIANPDQPKEIRIDVTAKNAYAVESSRSVTIYVEPPPAFTLQIEPKVVAIDGSYLVTITHIHNVSSIQPLALKIDNTLGGNDLAPFDLQFRSESDKLVITGNITYSSLIAIDSPYTPLGTREPSNTVVSNTTENRNLFLLFYNNTLTLITTPWNRFKLFFYETITVIKAAWDKLLHVAKGTYPHRQMITVTVISDDNPEISRSETIYVEELPFDKLWSQYFSGWYIPLFWRLLPWCLLLFCLWLFNFSTRRRVMDIPITVTNRGFTNVPCYLQAKEIPAPLQLDSTLDRMLSKLQGFWGRFQPKAFEYQPEAPAGLPDAHKMTMISLHNIDLYFLAKNRKLQPVDNDQSQHLPQRIQRASDSNTGIRLARLFHITKRRAVQWSQWRQTIRHWQWIRWVERCFNWTWTRFVRIVSYFVPDFANRDAENRNSHIRIIEDEWVRLEEITPDGTETVTLHVKPTSWNPPKLVRIIVRSTPNRIDEICQYELEVGLGMFEWSRYCRVITPDSHES